MHKHSHLNAVPRETGPIKSKYFVTYRKCQKRLTPGELVKFKKGCCTWISVVHIGSVRLAGVKEDDAFLRQASHHGAYRGGWIVAQYSASDL